MNDPIYNLRFKMEWKPGAWEEWSITCRSMAEVETALAKHKPDQYTLTSQLPQQLVRRDYEPEQKWGTPEDFRKHRQYGGTREDY